MKVVQAQRQIKYELNIIEVRPRCAIKKIVSSLESAAATVYKGGENTQRETFSRTKLPISYAFLVFISNRKVVKVFISYYFILF